VTQPRRFSADRVLTDLTGFQRDTVEHVVSRFYGPETATRFLVADETGLGKTMVARGVIARAIEELEHVDDVERIDIVYVCSNSDIAHQNLRKLDVTGDPHHGIASRLTLLAKHSRQLTPRHSRFTKPVNLVSFTPGTSFDKGWATGKSEERAMLYLLLEEKLNLTGRRATAAAHLLQGGVAELTTFRRTIEYLRGELEGDIDETVAKAFLGAAKREGLLGRFDGLIDELGQRRSVPTALKEPVRLLTGSMRSTLARESVQLLEPDIVILDEFQRFRHLLDPTTEAGELAHHLFDHPQARVLLLSATPYKPFTYAEEAADGDDHYSNFMQTINFLAAPLEGDPASAISTGLAAYRDAVVTGAPAAELTEDLRHVLLQVMTRTERPKSLGTTMATEIVTPADQLHEEDLLGYVALRALARKVDGAVSIDYWKSAPYFANFMDGYKIADKVRSALKDPEKAPAVRALLAATQHLDADALRHYRPVEMANSRLRQLAHDTVDAGWWQLLWVPASLPYLQPGGPYAEDFAASVTKRLIFSSWTATPTAIASLLSYEAERRTAEGSRLTENSPEVRSTMRSRLTYRTDPQGRAQSMTTLALFWPMPGLAALADPRAHRRDAAGPLTADDLQARLTTHLRPAVRERETVRGTAGEASYWIEAFGRPGSIPAALSPDEITAALSGEIDPDDEDQDPDDQSNLAAHVSEALGAVERRHEEPVAPDVTETLADLAAHSPANIAYRALARISADQPDVTDAGVWKAAALLASSLRSLFARPDTTVLLDKLVPDDPVYWRAILRYCAWGNLQAVMDEYLHHLAAAEGSRLLDDTALSELAAKAGEAISVRPARYAAFNPEDPEHPLGLTGRFALRYGGRKQDQESARQPQIRQAFNSPFWPLVLATTSVGQEGIDFHWWSHALLHWNTPANPVDFEQREGRIDRYDGHAVRRNIAHRHGAAILASDDINPWDAAYRLALDERGRLGEFAPHWVYPGPARIERHVAPYALSVDETRLHRIKRDVALYRLTFGQPRQEDMLELIKQQYRDGDAPALDALRLDLRAPSRNGHGP
jgi:hypothetical protein